MSNKYKGDKMMGFDNNEEVKFKSQKPETEEKPEIILQEQNMVNNRLLNNIIAQNGMMMVLLLKICEHNNIDLSELMKKIEEEKKAKL